MLPSGAGFAVSPWTSVLEEARPSAQLASPDASSQPQPQWESFYCRPALREFVQTHDWPLQWALLFRYCTLRPQFRGGEMIWTQLRRIIADLDWRTPEALFRTRMNDTRDGRREAREEEKSPKLTRTSQAPKRR